LGTPDGHLLQSRVGAGTGCGDAMVVLMPLVHRTCLFSKAEVKCEEVASVWAVFATTSAAKLWCLPRTGAFCEHVAPPGPGYGLDSAKRPVLNRKRGVWQNLVANQGLPHATGDNSRQSSLRTPLPRPWKTTMVASKVSSSSYPPQDTCTKATEDNERATQGEVSSEATKHRNQKPSPGGVSRSIADTDGAGGRPTRPQAKNIRPNATQGNHSICHGRRFRPSARSGQGGHRQSLSAGIVCMRPIPFTR